jgi:hypothetical protein
MAARLAAVLAGANTELVDKLGSYAESIGVAFQMQDDVLDLTGKEFAEKKGGRGQDITEGKRTLMVIHTLKKSSSKDKKRLIQILNMHTSDQKLRDEAIAIMEKHNAIEHVRQTASQIVQESWNDAEKLLPASEAKEKLKAFAEFLIKRNKYQLSANFEFGKRQRPYRGYPKSCVTERSWARRQSASWPNRGQTAGRKTRTTTQSQRTDDNHQHYTRRSKQSFSRRAEAYCRGKLARDPQEGEG